MTNEIQKIEEKINFYFGKLSLGLKILFVLLLVISVFLNFWIGGKNIYLNHRMAELENTHISNLERAQEQYSQIYTENLWLNKKIQNLNLQLIETINNTVELSVIFNQINNENITLLSLKDELSEGIKKTNSQLELMRNSIDEIINQKQEFLDNEELEILRQKNKL